MWTGSGQLHICVAPHERSLACRAVRSLHLSRSRSPRPHPWNRQRATASAQHAGGHCVEAPCCSCCVVLEKEAVASWCSCCVVLEKEAVASWHNVPEVAQEAGRRQRRRAPPSTCVLAPSCPLCVTFAAVVCWGNKGQLFTVAPPTAPTGTHDGPAPEAQTARVLCSRVVPMRFFASSKPQLRSLSRV